MKGYVTKNKVDPKVLTSYLDFVILAEERQTHRLQENKNKDNELKYQQMLDDFKN